MKCLILAAGYATRLYPLTENFPKPLLKVGDKTILDWLVDDIDTLNLIDEFVIISNHKFANHFNDWAKTKLQKITVVDDMTSTNETRLGAVKDIKFAIDALDIKDDMLVIAGDNVLDFSLTKFIEYAMKKKTTCVMRYYEENLQKITKSAALKIDENDLVLEMQEKPQNPQSHWCCPAFYYYTQEDSMRIENAISEGCATDAPGSFIVWLCKKTKVHAMEMPGSRYDIGNIESYNMAKEFYKGITK